MLKLWVLSARLIMKTANGFFISTVDKNEENMEQIKEDLQDESTEIVAYSVNNSDKTVDLILNLNNLELNIDLDYIH